METQTNDSAEVAQIFTSAGWTAGAKDGWDGQFVWRGGAVVGGIDPYGTPRVAGLTPPEGERGDVVTAALWLVDHAKQFAPDLTTEATLEPLALQSEEVETQGDESNGETGEADRARDGDLAGDGEAVALHAEEPAAESGSALFASGSELEAQEVSSDPLDAEYFELPNDPPAEVEDLGAELLDEGQAEFPALEGADPEDFAPDEFAPQEDQSGAFIFGPPADDTETLRSQRIGDVVRLSMAKQDAVWAASGTTRDAYQDLVSAVMRDTNQGIYTGPADQFERFTALQSWANAAAAVTEHERTQVGILAVADRPSLDAFDPEAGWPS